MLADTRSKVIMSLNALGKVREYQLNQRFRFRLVDKGGAEIIGPSEISLRRDMPYDDTQVLAKEQEENLLYQDMQKDLIQQLLRRLATARHAWRCRHPAPIVILRPRNFPPTWKSPSRPSTCSTATNPCWCWKPATRSAPPPGSQGYAESEVLVAGQGFRWTELQ